MAGRLGSIQSGPEMSTLAGTNGPRPPGPPQFFISYTGDDIDWAEWIAWQLEDANYRVIIQKWDFALGSVIDNIERGFSDADKTLLVWSERYGRSTFTKEERDAALFKDKGAQGRLLIVRVDESTVLPMFDTRVRVDLAGRDEKEARNLLIDTVKGGVKPAAKPDFPAAHTSKKPPPSYPPDHREKTVVADESDLSLTMIGPLTDHYGKSRIQVIGWKGIENRIIYDEFIRKGRYQLAFLTTEMSFETLPSLHYYELEADHREPMPFDAVYMDYEFADRYRELGLIANLNANGQFGSYGGWDGSIARSIKRLLWPNSISDKTPVYSAPIQFGFNEVLINPNGHLGEELRTKVSDRNAVWSYSDFSLEKLLSDGKTRVAVWHWYLPSMLQMVLSLGEENVSEVSNRLRQATQPGNRLRQATQPGKLLEDFIGRLSRRLRSDAGWRGRLWVTSNLNDVRGAIRDFEAGIVLGIGSSVLSAESDLTHVRAVVPKQGVFLWINCAAAIEKDDRTAANALIRHWLQCETQKKMFDTSREYIGLPVDKRALRDVLGRSTHATQTVQTFRALCRPSDGVPEEDWLFDSAKVACRVLPRHLWGRWVILWEQFVSAARANSLDP
jgi:hypothetical protein